MSIPKEVQERIDLLNNYKVNDKLEEFDICHLYPTKIAFPDGYYDARREGRDRGGSSDQVRA